MTLPNPPETEAPKLCAACGADNPSGHWTLDSATYRDVLGARLCGCCSFTRPALETANAIRARRSQPTPTPEARPIQAGDWVECVGDYPVKAEVKQGCRYRVALTEVNSFGEPCLRVSPAGLRISTAMFKRVDGPHPNSSEPGAYELMECCGRERDKDGCPNPHCECPAPVKPSSVPVGTGNAQSSGTGGAVDPYTEHRLKREPMWLREPEPTDPEARKRTEDWLAALAQSERPTRSRAERASLEAGHPASWLSNEGEE